MIKRASLVLLCAACQQQSGLEYDVLGISKPESPGASVVTPVDSAPVAPRASVVSDPPPPPLSATAWAAYDPPLERSRHEVRAVTIWVEVLGARPGPLALELSTPDGTLYERQVQLASGSPYVAQRFSFVMPVAGTWVEAHDLTGTWAARAFFDDRELLHQPFEVTQ